MSEETKEKTVLINNDGLNWNPHTTTSNTVSELMTEMNIEAENVVVRQDNSVVTDYNAPVSDDQVYNFMYRNKVGGN